MDDVREELRMGYVTSGQIARVEEFDLLSYITLLIMKG